uniref:Uncharacterized protein n=1 Tax=Globodera rostochiensis TaxID=31243 RepID=A0A914IES7_GLORO
MINARASLDSKWLKNVLMTRIRHRLLVSVQISVRIARRVQIPMKCEPVLEHCAAISVTKLVPRLYQLHLLLPRRHVNELNKYY